MTRTLSDASIIEQIKAAFPLVAELQADGHVLQRCGQRFKCVCPFHEERTPSCFVSPDRGTFYCFGCGAKGSVIDYYSFKRGIRLSDAIRELGRRALAKGFTSPNLREPFCRDNHLPLPRLRLSSMERGSSRDLHELAKLRNLSVEALALAQKDGVLFFAKLRGYRSWIITDKRRIVAQARRLDGRNWEHLNDAPKAWTLRGGCQSWPVNVPNIGDRRKTMLVEGGPDLLSAYHLLWCENRHDVTPVAILGAACQLHAAALRLFTGRTVRIYPHTDESGVRAALRWDRQLRSVGAKVTCFDFSGLRRFDGERVCDLNDYLLLGYDDWEVERLEEVLP
jgi:hypothetical protein